MSEVVVARLEKQVQDLKNEREALVDGYEKRLKLLQDKLDKVLAISILEDAKTSIRDSSFDLHLPELPKALTQDFTIDDNTEEWLFSELISRQKRIPPNKLLQPNDNNQLSKTLNSSFEIVSKDCKIDEVLSDALSYKETEKEIIMNALSRLDDWSFTQFTFDSITKGNPLIVLAYHLLDSTGTIQSLKLEPKKVLNFFSAIQSRYHNQNPYHNRMHAADVLQAVHYLMSTDVEVDKKFSHMDRLILYFAAAIHDFDHPGVNNNFMINTASSQAILYNDKSVLENHHIAAAFLVYDNQGNNFLSHVTREEYKLFRASVVDIVLATDLSLHFGFVTLFKNKVAEKEAFNPFEKNDDKIIFFKILLKCGDVSHPARQLENHLKWSRRCFDEFFRQGDEEKRLKLPASPFMDRDTTKLGGAQLGFIEFICMPVFEALDQFIKLGIVIENLRCNRNYWKQKKEEEDAKGVSYAFPPSAQD